MGDEPKVIPGHVGYSPDYKGESPRHVSGVVVVTDEMLRGPPIDIPSIMRSGGFEEGVKAERARVVAWLRLAEGQSMTTRSMWAIVATHVENGEHAAPIPPPK